MDIYKIITSCAIPLIYCRKFSVHEDVHQPAPLRYISRINVSRQLYSIGLRIFTVSFFFIMLIFCTSCTPKTDTDLHKKDGTQKKDLSCSILFVLGKDFSRYSDIFTYLSEVYTPESLKAQLNIISYSDMTAKTKHPRLSIIAERLAAEPADVLISLGIPEGGARTLRTIKERNPAQHIFSLLPVEEILPLEAYSDIVADFELPDSFTNADRAVNIPAQEVQTLVLCAVTAAEQLEELPDQEPLPRFMRATATATALLKDRGIPAWGGTHYVLQPYKDPELNIRSYNYVILSQPAADGTAQKPDGTPQGAARE